MRGLPRFIPHCIVLAIAVWCLVSLRGDLAQLSVGSLAQSWDLVLRASALSLLNYLLRAIRWRSFLARLGHALSFRFAVSTYVAGFAYTLFPGKMGEIARSRYYLPLRIPLSDVAGAFFVERLIDVLTMTLLATLILTSFARYRGIVMAAAAVVVAAMMLLAWLERSPATGALGSSARVPRMLRKPLAILDATLAATRPLLQPGPLAVGLALGLTAWVLEGIGLGVLTQLAPSAPHLTLTTVVGIYGVALLAGGLSFLPGGLGSTEAVMAALLVASGFSLPQALLVTLTCRLVTLWLAVFLGWAAVLALRQRASVVAVPWR
jgi:uncharacterized protein (TIRG00374 family)